VVNENTKNLSVPLDAFDAPTPRDVKHGLHQRHELLMTTGRRVRRVSRQEKFKAQRKVQPCPQWHTLRFFDLPSTRHQTDENLPLSATLEQD
jgi:hypothetical protein